MDRNHMVYEKHDNCFTSIEDLSQAQQLMDRLNQLGWVVCFRQACVKAGSDN
jgi:hypothetical protein